MKRILVTGAGGFTWYNRVIEKHPALAGRGMSQSGVSTMTTPSIPPTKTCTKCGETFPATTEYFYRFNRGEYGVQSRCKSCTREYGRKYRSENRELIAQRKHKYYEENKEAHQKYTQEWRKKNRDRHLEHTAKHRHKYREERREYNRLWIRKNANKANTASMNYRARKAKAEGGYTVSELQEQFKRQKGECFYCGDKLPKQGWHADHVIPLSKGGSNYISNIVCACATCNVSKGDRMVHEWKGTDRLL